MKENKRFTFSNAEYRDGVYKVVLNTVENDKMVIDFNFSNFVLLDDTGSDAFNNIRILLNEAFLPKKYKISDEIKEQLTKQIYNYIKYCTEQSNADFNLFKHININYEDDKGTEYSIEIEFKNKAPESKPPVYRIENIAINVNNIRKKEVQEIVGEDLDDNPPYITYGFKVKTVTYITSEGGKESYDLETFLDLINDSNNKNEFYEKIVPEILNNIRIHII